MPVTQINTRTGLELVTAMVNTKWVEQARCSMYVLQVERKSEMNQKVVI